MNTYDISLFLVGFGWYSLLIFPFLKVSKKWQDRFRTIDNSAVQIARVLLIAYLFFWVVSVSKSLLAPGDLDYPSHSERMFGEYWPYFWSTPFFIILLSIQLAIKKLRWKIWMRILGSIVLVWLDAREVLIIIITSFHRDHAVTDSAYELTFGLLRSWSICTAIFLALLLIVLGIKKLARRIRASS